MNEMMVFEGNNVEVFEINGTVMFNPQHVGVCLGVEDATVRRHLAEMDSDEVVKLEKFGCPFKGL